MWSVPGLRDGRPRWLIGVTLVALVACRAPFGGLTFAPAGSESGQGAAGVGATGQARPDTASEASGDPIIERLVPDNGGPGAEITIIGKNLTVAGAELTYADRRISTIPQPDGSLKWLVPLGAQNAYLAATRGDARSSRFFRVLGRLHVAMLRGLPAPVDAELPVGVTAYDSTDHLVLNPHYDLSVDPPEAADVISTSSVIPRKATKFRVQAHSGSLKSFDLVVACQNKVGPDKFEANFVLKEFAGDGNPIQWIGSQPQLMQKSAFSDGFAELGPADLAHLTRPWGLVRVNLPKLGDGLLISDSGSARIRWVSLKGDRIVTVVGGGRKVATPTATTSPLELELVAPAGLAFGKDFTPPGGTAPQVVAIVDRGRNQVLAWDINDNGVKVIAGTGAPTFTRQTATDSALVQNSALGDADLAKKICGEATVATMWEPASVAILHKGAESIFLIADTNNNRIRRIVRKSSAALLAGEFANCTQTGIATFSGVITTVFGNGKPGDNLAASPIDAASNSTQIDNPTDILIDPTGPEFFTYVSDSNNNRVIKITNATNTAANVTVSGRTVVPPPGGTTVGKLNHPSGIYLHPVTRDLVIADTLNNRILVLDQLGGLTTQASCSLDASPSFALDVPKSSLVWPHAIVSESETTTTFPIFVADLFTNKVRKLRKDKLPD